MAPPTDEDIEWFRSTFRPIPKPQLPDDCIEYSLYCISSGNVDSTADADLARTRLTEVQKAAAELMKTLLKDYIWQRDAFKLEMTREDGEQVRLLAPGYQVFGGHLDVRELTISFANVR